MTRREAILRLSYLTLKGSQRFNQGDITALSMGTESLIRLMKLADENHAEAIHPLPSETPEGAPMT